MINQTWYIHTMEYYSAIKRSEILIHTASWINHENMMLSERRWTQRVIYCKYIVSRIGNFIKTESMMVVAEDKDWFLRELDYIKSCLFLYWVIKARRYWCGEQCHVWRYFTGSLLALLCSSLYWKNNYKFSFFESLVLVAYF